MSWRELKLNPQAPSQHAEMQTFPPMNRAMIAEADAPVTAIRLRKIAHGDESFPSSLITFDNFTSNR